MGKNHYLGGSTILSRKTDWFPDKEIGVSAKSGTPLKGAKLSFMHRIIRAHLLQLPPPDIPVELTESTQLEIKDAASLHAWVQTYPSYQKLRAHVIGVFLQQLKNKKYDDLHGLMLEVLHQEKDTFAESIKRTKCILQHSKNRKNRQDLEKKMTFYLKRYNAISTNLAGLEL